MSEQYEFPPPYEVVEFLPRLEKVVFSPLSEIEVNLDGETPEILQQGSKEAYHFFISDRFNFGEFPSGPRGVTAVMIITQGVDPEPADLVIAEPTLVHQKVMIGGEPKWKRYIVEPAA